MSSILSVNNFGFNDYSLKSENAKKKKMMSRQKIQRKRKNKL
ncbi:hypothetical protein [uncultured Clostridium sp.]|nr:hypothetical protein [uncultured Clostridium sp.]